MELYDIVSSRCLQLLTHDLTAHCIFSYNRVNGTHVSENPYIIQDILRKEWGFDGATMSDWWELHLFDFSPEH